MVAMTGARAASIRIVLRFFEPFGRPPGLPLLPGLYRELSGGSLRAVSLLFGSTGFRLALVFLGFAFIGFPLGTLLGDRGKVEVGFRKSRADPIDLLEAADDGIDVIRIHLDAETAPAGLLSGDQRRAASGKPIENAASPV